MQENLLRQENSNNWKLSLELYGTLKVNITLALDAFYYCTSSTYM